MNFMLSPYRILDLTDERSNLTGLLLAQLGAEVIAIEPSEGARARHLGPFADDSPNLEGSLTHWAWNRGKKSVIGGIPEIEVLASTADVILDCGAFKNLDLSALRKKNPSLLTVTLSPFGASGPKHDWLATDLTLLASGGQLGLTGDPDRAPVQVGAVPQGWLHGALEAAEATTIALYERSASGFGQHIDVSAQQAVTQCTQTYLMTTAVGAPPVARAGGGIKAGDYVLRTVYPATDGFVSITFMFGSMLGPYSQRLMNWVYEEGYCDKETRDQNWVDFFMMIFSGQADPLALYRAQDAIAALTATKSKGELMSVNSERRLLIAPVATTKDIVESEHLKSREFFEEVDQVGYKFPGRFAKASTPLKILGAPPKLGQHTKEILGDLQRKPACSQPAGTPPTGAPLAGVKVLDFTWAVAAPMATRSLADHGATVVRIESEGRMDVIRNAGPFVNDVTHPDNTAQYHSINAGKYLMSLDLSKEAARQVIWDLVDWADVIVESFTPKAMANWGFDYSSVKKRKPEIVMLSSCLMGQTGPMNMYPGFGNLAGALSGFYEITGWPDRPPTGPFLAYTDYTGPRFAVTALVSALDQKRRTGEGCYIDLSQHESALHLLGPALLDQIVNERVGTRSGNASDRYSVHGVYPTQGNDKWIAIVCQNEEAEDRLCQLIGVEDLDDQVIGRWTVTQDRFELQEMLQSHDIAAHIVVDSADAVADPQLTHRNHFRRVPQTYAGETVVEGSHYQLSRTPSETLWGGPPIGEHTFEVLSDMLGYDGAQIADLAAAEALY
jgi:crotonobetainyl-CoA:carnitine CoA-transferase CaiB-like acyl-CoA transferase|tara:strand:+ start:4147 stop:6498 length:2352 start_codon:yes stop_codon:yes gene_type:complete